MSNRVKVILVNGPACSGKTTLAKKISEEFGLPLICKDEIKESLFDTLGYEIGNDGWSRKLGKASYGVLFKISESLLKAGKSHIIESNFNPELANQSFLELGKANGFDIIQIVLKVDKEILIERHKKRYEEGKRHSGHYNDKLIAEGKNELVLDVINELDVVKDTYYLDVNDFNKIDYGGLLNYLRSKLENGN